MTSPIIPYITLRAGEHDLSRQALVLQPYGTGKRLAYRDEQPEDRDFRGNLHCRVSQSLDLAGWPTGPADREQVHAARQRECMGEFLCHVCRRDVGESATERGTLFVEAVDPRPC